MESDMNAPSFSWRDKAWSLLRERPFTISGGILLLVVAIPFCRRHDSEWEQVYIRAAARLCSGEEMYRMRDAYLYPPFMAWTALPFLSLSARASRLLWLAINGLSLIALYRWSWQTAGGGRLEGAGKVPRRERLAAVLGALCGISYLQNCLAHQQTDIVLGAMLAGGCLLLTRGRFIWAATSFGLAAACKCTALLWMPYLLWRRRPVAAVWLFIVAIGANLLPNLVRPAPDGGLWVRNFATSFLMPLTESERYLGTWGSDPIYNQSLVGLGHRWCTTTIAWSVSECAVQPRLPLLDPQALRIGIIAAAVAILGIVVWICGRPFRPIVDDNRGSLLALECGIVLLLMLLLSPMSSKAHFGTTTLAAFCLARSALSTRGRIISALLAGSLLLGMAGNKDPLGERLYTLSLWYGIVTWQTLLLLAGCLLIYRRTKGRIVEPIPYPRYALGGLFGSKKPRNRGASRFKVEMEASPITLSSDCRGEDRASASVPHENRAVDLLSSSPTSAG